MTQDPLARVEEVLAEVVELDLALARKVHAAAMAATEPQALSSLSRTYQRVARSVRQTAALIKSVVAARAAAETAAAARAAKDRPPPLPSFLARSVRRRLLRNAVCGVAFDEYERGESSELELEQRMTKAVEMINFMAEQPDFERCDPDEQVRMLCEALDLDPETAARWRDLDSPPSDDEDAPPEPPPPNPSG